MSSHLVDFFRGRFGDVGLRARFRESEKVLGRFLKTVAGVLVGGRERFRFGRGFALVGDFSGVLGL